MKKVLLLSLLFVLFTTLGFSQTDKFWSLHTELSGKITTDKAVARQSFPKIFKLYNLNIAPLRQDLFSIVGSQARSSSTIISLPNADGQIEQFEVYEASNFEPALQAQFPQIRAYSGKGITDKYATLKLSISPQGIQTMVFRTDKANEFIEPYSQDHTVYAVFTSQRTKGNLPWTCSTDDHALMTDVNAQIGNTHRPENSDGTLRTMRLAQSCNGEYANYFGAFNATQVALVLAAYNATLTRCNGCYEKDLALHLNLIANTTAVIYYDPTTDPYTTLGAWNGQLQATLNTVIGAPNYDIGHMFGASGGGGNAGCIGCVCNDSNKGSGITSPADGIPQGDNFDIDYVVHEVGHQLGGNHTFSHNLEGSGVNKEVGSGITIMAYAGITNQDVAPHSIDIYHEASIAQIQANLATKTCPISTNISANNATPVVAPVTNRTIPKSTPFILTGSATDANAADALTYCWEQNDNATTSGVNSVASPTKATGPNWLSFSPTANPSRTFPILATILAGNFITGPLPGGDAGANIEALSSVGRNLNFRLTVRDNSPYVSSGAGIKVGQTAFTDMIVTVDATSGPFQVTVPNTAVSYPASSVQTVTWSVNNTTAAPVSCANVNILISTNGGNTFTTLLANTPNDGSEAVTMPATTTTTARIKVESVGNIFFDISDANFSIVAPVTDFNFGTTTATTVACPAPATPTVTIPTTATGGFSNPITLAATTGVPAGTTVTFGTNPVTPGNSSIATLNNANTLPAGTYTIGISGTASGASVKNTTISFVITAGAPPVITTNSASTSVCAPATATFTVASSTAGVAYQWQSAAAATPTVFTNIPGATAASYTTAATSAAMSGNVYRCIVSTQCGTVTSANAVLTVNTAAAITTQPTNQTACTGGTATFTAAATGTGVSYQWQSGTSAAGPWTNVGTNATTYTTAALAVGTPLFYQVIASTTTCPASVTSSVATLGLSVTTAINTQPTAQAVCAGATATYSVAAVGTGVSYQWQSGPSATGPWTNVGTNSTSYTTAATTTAMSGTYYQVVVTGSCNTVTSTPVLLTVNTAAAITTQPTAVTLCNGVAATFTVAATGTGVTYQWQSGPSATGPWTNVTGGTGATTASYTTAATTPAMNGTYYRVVATTTTCAATINSSAVLLTVNTVAVIGTQPAAQTACIPNTATFSVAATGTGLGYQWQVSTDGGANFSNITGATNASYTTAPAVIGMNNNQYKVLVTSTCSATGTLSNAAILTVINPVSVSQNPVATSGCAGDNYSFSVTASPSNVTYQWQVSSDNGTSYTSIAGATSATYTITNAILSMSGNLYRVVVSGVPCGIITTPGAKLTLSLRPAVVATIAATSNSNPAVNTTLTTTVSPAGGNFIYNWKKNGTVIPNSLATTFFVLPVDDNGTYTVTITDPTTGCTSAVSAASSNPLTSDNLLGGKVFIYPNPVSTIMHVRFNTSNNADRGTMLNIYDEKGARVFSKAYAIVGTLGNMDVDMSSLQLGTYLVYIMDATGKKLATGKVVKVQ
jgi:Metallo-peptidase family M12B Reprolysin-like/Secretion system C-terminal sorting domain